MVMNPMVPSKKITSNESKYPVFSTSYAQVSWHGKLEDGPFTIFKMAIYNLFSLPESRYYWLKALEKKGLKFKV